MMIFAKTIQLWLGVMVASMSSSLFAEDRLPDGEYLLAVDRLDAEALDGKPAKLTKGDRILTKYFRERDEYMVIAAMDARKLKPIPASKLISVKAALERFNKDLEKSPNATNYLARAKARTLTRGLKDTSKLVRADVDRAIKLRPDSALGYFFRAHLAIEDKNAQMADYTKAISLDADLAPAYFFRSRLRNRENETLEMTSDLIQTVRLVPSWTAAIASIQNHLEWFEGEPGERDILDLMLAHFGKEVEENPRLFNKVESRDGGLCKLIVDCYRKRGVLATEEGDARQAIADFSRFVDLHAKSSSKDNDDLALVLAKRSMIRASFPDPKYRNGELALVDAKRAVALDTNNRKGSLSALAAAFAESGNFESAIATQERVVQLEKKSRKHHERRLQYYKGKKPIRELRGVDLVPYSNVPLGNAKRSPKEVMELFYQHLATNDFDKAFALLLPGPQRQGSRFNRDAFEAFTAPYIKAIRDGRIKFTPTEFKIVEDECTVIVRYEGNTFSGAEVANRGFSLRRTVVGWLIEPEIGMALSGTNPRNAVLRQYLEEMKKPEAVFKNFPQPPKNSYLRVTYPNGGETKKRGDELTIKWETNAEQTPVAISLVGIVSGKPSDTYALTKLTENDGEFKFTLSDDRRFGYREYKVRITTVVGELSDESERPFRLRSIRQ